MIKKNIFKPSQSQRSHKNYFKIIKKIDLNNIKFTFNSEEKLDLLIAAVNEFMVQRIETSSKDESISYFLQNMKRYRILVAVMDCYSINSNATYKEQIIKKLRIYSYKTISSIIDDAISRGYFKYINRPNKTNKEKIKKFRPTTSLVSNYVNWTLVHVKNIKFSVVRYGNVLNSRGSVLPLFKKQMKESYFTITDLKMTRFLITLNESVELILQSIIKSLGSEIFIPKLKSFKIVDLAKSLKKDAKFKIIGIRPGEKLHEELISKDDSTKVIELKNLYILTNPFIEKNRPIKFIEKFYGGKKINKEFIYNSYENLNFHNTSSLTKILKNLDLHKI